MSKRDVLLWVDIETTGLDPNVDKMIEVAWLWTKMSGEPLALPGGNYVIWHDPASIGADDYVKAAHAQSGLWADLESECTVTRWFAASAWCRSVATAREEANGIYLAGASVHFDRSFLERAFSMDGISHRHLDVTSLKLMLKSLGVTLPQTRQYEPKHRAFPDIRSSLAEYAAIREAVAGRMAVT